MAHPAVAGVNKGYFAQGGKFTAVNILANMVSTSLFNKNINK